MPNFYDNIDDYEYNCQFWGSLNRRLREMYQPNPWIFESAYQPMASRQHFVITFRNFDRSRRLIVEYDPDFPGDEFRFPSEPHEK